MSTKIIQTPPATPDQESKLKRFFQTMSEYMDVDIAFSTRSIMTIEIPSDRSDAITVVQRVLKGIEKANNNGTASKSKSVQSVPEIR